MAGFTCSFDGCGRPTKTDGRLCPSHNAQRLRGEKVRPLFSPRAKRRNARWVCEFPGCGKKHLAKGCCKGHYRQLVAGVELHSLERPPRPVTVDPSNPAVAHVQLTQGYFATIDSADADAVGKFKWNVLIPSHTRTIYASRSIHPNQSEGLHRFPWRLWGMPGTPQIDHVNTDGLDCRRSNLRAATVAQNNQNKAPYRNNTSGFKGVVFHKASGKWAATIGAQGRSRHLGIFSTRKEAAAVYAEAAKRLHGEFARTE